MSLNKKYRLQFDFYEEAYEELKKLRSLTGTHTFSEVIRNALGCYKYIANHVIKGSKILVEHKNEKGELVTKEVVFNFIKISENSTHSSEK